MHQFLGARGKLCSYLVSSFVHSANIHLHLPRCKAPAEGAKIYKENTCPQWNCGLGGKGCAGNKACPQMLIIKVSITLFANTAPEVQTSFHLYTASFLDVPCLMWVIGADDIHKTETRKRRKAYTHNKKKT